LPYPVSDPSYSRDSLSWGEPHRSAKCLDTFFREAEGSAQLHRRAIQHCLDDRLSWRAVEQSLRLAWGTW